MKKIILICLWSTIIIFLIVFSIYYNKKTVINMESKTLVKLYVNSSGTIKDVSFKGKDIYKKDDFVSKKIKDAPQIIVEKEVKNKLLEEKDEYNVSITIDSESDKTIKKYKNLISKKQMIKINNGYIILSYECCKHEDTMCKKSC